MSVVAARVYDDKIVMAADSIRVRGWSKNTDDNFSKIVSLNGMIIGFVGKCEEGSLMQVFAKTHKPDSPTEKDVLSFIVEFYKYKKDITGSGQYDANFLIAVSNHLFCVEGFLVYEVKDYCAIGAGEDFSNAALYLGNSPSKAVEVACNLCCMVAEPIIEFVMEYES